MAAAHRAAQAAERLRGLRWLWRVPVFGEGQVWVKTEFGQLGATDEVWLLFGQGRLLDGT